MPIVGPQIEFKQKGTAAQTSATLTHGVGTADGTVDDVGGSFSQSTLNNNFKECTDRINKLVAEVTAILAVLQDKGINV